MSKSELQRGTPNPEEWKAVRHALANDSDRSVALLGAAFLDNMLEREIKDEFVALPAAEHEKIFLPGPGALSSTEPKIQLCYCLGMYGAITKKDMSRIVQIRNIFAHSNYAVTFQTEAIKNICLELAAIKEYERLGLELVNFKSFDMSDPRLLYINSCLVVPMTVYFNRRKDKDGSIRINVKLYSSDIP